SRHTPAVVVGRSATSGTHPVRVAVAAPGGRAHGPERTYLRNALRCTARGERPVRALERRTLARRGRYRRGPCPSHRPGLRPVPGCVPSGCGLPGSETAPGRAARGAGHRTHPGHGRAVGHRAASSRPCLLRHGLLVTCPGYVASDAFSGTRATIRRIR